jgi:hypothetical protein
MDKLYINFKDNILVKQYVVNFNSLENNVQQQVMISKYYNYIKKYYRKCIIWDVGTGSPM